MRTFRFLVPAACCMAAGCYTYRPTDPAELQPSAEIRARLTTEETARLGTVVPVEQSMLEGTVVERSGDSLMLLVPVSSELRGMRVETLHQRVQVPVSGIAGADLRRLDRTRTGLLIGAAVAAVATATIAALSGGGSSKRDVPNPPPGESRFAFPLLRIVW